jgi:hypothetical protein
MTIEPDSKDWTWVLERRCPECAFDASTVEPQAVAAMIRANAATWQSVLSRPGVSHRPATDDRWSPLEYACHVRDVFTLYDERLALMLDSDDPTYANWDQDETAVANRYREQDPAQVGDELAAAASAIADRFDTVHGAQWQRTGNRSDGARFTVATFARYLIHDPIHHLFDVGA